MNKTIQYIAVLIFIGFILHFNHSLWWILLALILI